MHISSDSIVLFNDAFARLSLDSITDLRSVWEM